MAFLTAGELAEKGACCSGRETFVGLFPHGVDVTVELCVKHAFDFDWQWAGDYLLSGDAQSEFLKRANVAARKREDGYSESHKDGRCGEACTKVSREWEEALARAFGELYCGAK